MLFHKLNHPLPRSGVQPRLLMKGSVVRTRRQLTEGVSLPRRGVHCFFQQNRSKNASDIVSADTPPKFTTPAVDASVKEVLIPEFEEVPSHIVAEAQLCRWLGVYSVADASIASTTTPVKGIHANLSIAGTVVEVNNSRHALLCLVMKEKGGERGRPHMDDLTLHWGTVGGDGWQWVAPPPGCYYYPSKGTISPLAGKVAWQIPFAKHASPDGFPLYVALLQLPISDGVLKTGGISFVLTANEGSTWMHNYHTSKDWFMQLSNWLPTTPSTALPAHPSTQFQPSTPATQSEALKNSLLTPIAVDEEMDVTLLRSEDEELSRLRAVMSAAQREVEKHEGLRAVALDEARREAGLAAAPPPPPPKFPPAVPPLHLPKAPTPPARPLKPAAAASEEDSSVGKAEVLVDHPDPATLLAQQLFDEGLAEMYEKEVEKYEEEVAEQLREYEEEVKRLEEVHGRAEAERAELIQKLEKEYHIQCTEAELLRTKAEVACDKAKGVAAAEADAIASGQSEVRAAHEAESAFKEQVAAARRRQEARQRERQLEFLRSQMSIEGPEEVLDTSRLVCSSIPSGLNASPVPGSHKHYSHHAGDDFSHVRPPVPCTFKALQFVAGQQLRKFMGIPSQGELHILQYRFEVDLLRDSYTPGGGRAPILVWLSCQEEAQEDGSVSKHAIVTVLTDALVQARPDSGMVLRWGGCAWQGERMAPTLPAGWTTSPNYTWECGDNAKCTPFSHHFAPALDQYDCQGTPGAMCVILKLPLKDIFSVGGLSFQLKNSAGSLLNNPITRQPFFLQLQPLACYGLDFIHAHTRKEEEAEEEEEEAEEEVAGDGVGVVGDGVGEEAILGEMVEAQWGSYDENQCEP